MKLSIKKIYSELTINGMYTCIQNEVAKRTKS